MAPATTASTLKNPYCVPNASIAPPLFLRRYTTMILFVNQLPAKSESKL
jgi:hypothetical protein